VEVTGTRERLRREPPIPLGQVIIAQLNPELDGTVTLRDVEVAIDGLPTPVTNTNSEITLSGTTARLESFTTEVGAIAASADGSVDLGTGFNITAGIEPVTLTELLDVVAAEAPVPLLGEVDARVEITGGLTTPRVDLEAINTEPLLVDRLEIDRFSANMVLTETLLDLQNFRIVPAEGGSVTGMGTLSVTDFDLELDANVTDIPGAIARNYIAGLPDDLGVANANITVTGNPTELDTLNAEGTAALDLPEGSIELPSIQFANGILDTGIDIRQVPLGQFAPALAGSEPVSGDFDILVDLGTGELEAIDARVTGDLQVASGSVAIPRAAFNDSVLTAALRIREVRLAQLLPQLQGQISPGEAVSGDFDLALDLGTGELEQFAGEASGELRLAGGSIAIPRASLNNSELTAGLRVREVRPAQLLPQLQGQPGAQEAIFGNFDVALDLDTGELEQIEGGASGELRLAGGRVSIPRARVGDGDWDARVEVANVRVGQLLPTLPEYARGVANAQVTLDGTLSDLSLAGIRASGAARLTEIADGTIAINNIALADGVFGADIVPTQLQLGAVNPEFAGSTVSGAIAVRADTSDLSPAGVRAQGSVVLPEGAVVLSDPIEAAFRWTGDRLELDAVSARNLNASGFVEVDLSQRDPVEIVERFNFDATVSNFNLAPLTTLVPASIPAPNLRGLADFDGTLSGTLTDPRLDGTVGLSNFAVERLEFDPRLSGPVAFTTATGFAIDLRGESDRISAAAAWTPNNTLPVEPTDLLLRVDGAVVEGDRSGRAFVVAIDEFPVGVVKDLAPLSPELAAQPASGLASGQIALNLDSFAANGEVLVERPRFSRLSLDQASATFAFNGSDTLVLQSGQLLLGDTEVNANGRVALVPGGPEVRATVAIPRGEIQDLLTAAQVATLADLNLDFLEGDFGDASDLAAVEDIDDVCQSLIGTDAANELERDELPRLNFGAAREGADEIAISRLQASTSFTRYDCFRIVAARVEAAEEARAEAELLPPLTTASGSFSGEINVTGSLATPPDPAAAKGPVLPLLTVDVDLDGEDWIYGPLNAREFLARGRLSDGVVTIDTAGLRSGDRFAGIRGTLLGPNQSAQARVANVPLAPLQSYVPLPEGVASFDGTLNASVAIAGSQRNPQARGEVSVANAEFNDKPIETVAGSFLYDNALLELFLEAQLAAEIDPLTVDGRIPYMLPFAEVPPADDRLSLAVRVRDEGLRLLNLATREQLTWEGGSGSVDLEITGPFDPNNFDLAALQAQGIIDLQDAAVATQVLPDPVTDITGEIAFNLNSFAIEGLTARYGGGEIEVLGTLPLFEPGGSTERLQIKIGELSARLEGLFDGEIRGQVNIAGAALAPVVGGDVRVSNAQVTLTGAAGATGGAPAEGADPPDPPVEIELDDLYVVLVEDVFVGVPPVANFLAEGDFVLNGTLSDLRPDGVVTVREGSLNIGSTQFRVARGEEQTATFVPARGLDPVLDVTLVAQVTETTQPVTVGSPDVTEFEDAPATSFGSLRTVRVMARAQGPASELVDQDGQVDTDAIQLTSEPNRSESEIVALIGGSLFNPAGGAALGLANLASTAFLGSFQAEVSRALGLSEFRIYPTVVPSDDEEDTDGLGLAAEAGVDVTDNVTFSVLALLNAEVSPLFNLRYQISDQFRFRAATDFDDSQALIEYDTRF